MSFPRMDVINTLGQGRIFLSRSALLHNIRVLRQIIPEGTQICAVAKADAYGIGARLVADALTNFTSGSIEAPAIDALAVATLEEAAELVSCVVPIHVLRPIDSLLLGQAGDLLELAIRDGWALTLASAEPAAELARLALT